jgi:hypothetical protein
MSIKILCKLHIPFKWCVPLVIALCDNCLGTDECYFGSNPQNCLAQPRLRGVLSMRGYDAAWTIVGNVFRECNAVWTIVGNVFRVPRCVDHSG